MRRFILKLIVTVFTLCIIINVCVSEHMTANACWAAPKELDEILGDCYSIARGTLVGIRDSEPRDYICSTGDYKYYTFEITECYMGDVDGKESIELQIYDASAYLRPDKKPYLIEGNEYVLMISKNRYINRGDSYEYQSLIIGLNEDKIDGVYYVGDKYPYEFPSTVEELESKITEFYDNPKQNGNTSGIDYTESSNIEDIISFSDNIAKVRIDEIDVVDFKEFKCKFLSCKAEVLENIKGELGEKVGFTAHLNEIEVDKEYLVLLHSSKNNLDIDVSSYYSIIPFSDTKRVEKYLDTYYHLKSEEYIEVTSSNIIKNIAPLYAMLVIIILTIVTYLISVIYNKKTKR